MKVETRWRTAACWLAAAAHMVVAQSSSWGAVRYVPSVYPTIQAGIDAAAFGDTVLVAPGTYTDYQTRTLPGGGVATFAANLKNRIVLKSEGGPGVTTIDMNETSGPQPIGIIALSLPSDLTTVEGFTIDGRDRSLGAYVSLCGNVTLRSCIFQNFEGGPTTGGAVIVNGDASFFDCEFVNCKANAAGALYFSTGHLDFIGCTVRDCRNAAVWVRETGGGTGSATIIDCQFLDNISTEGGAGGLLVGPLSGGATIRDCLFKNNINMSTGAGGLRLGTGPKTVESCVFIENGALGPNGQGGALCSDAIPLVVRNNTFLGNYKSANVAPGAALAFASFGVFENNTVVGSHGGAVIEDFYGGMDMSCNVYWDNPEGVGVPLAPTDREVDPLFCDPSIDDLTLREGSPCLPEDPLGCGLIGAFEQGCATTAVSSESVASQSWGKIKALYR